MNFYNIGRFVDHRLGAIACTVLMLVKTIGVSLRLIPYKEKPETINRIVFIKIIGFGSIILTTPAIKALRKKYPEAHISIVTLTTNKNITELTQLFDEVIAINASLGLFGTIINCFSVLNQVRNKKPDIIFDLEIFSNLSSLFVFLSGPVFSVGFGSFKLYRDVFYNEKIAFDHSRHMIDIYCKMVSILDVYPDNKSTDCFGHLSDKDHTDFIKKFPEIDFSNHSVVFVNVNSGDLAWQRRIPLSKFAEIITTASHENNSIRFVLIGGPSDVQHVNNFYDLLEDATKEKTINVAGKTSFRELLAFFRFGDAYVGNDSGPLHLAVSMNLPAIAFFGPETPRLYGYDFAPHIMFYNNIFCSPCMNSFHYKISKCKKNICLESINNNEVVMAIVQTVGEKKKLSNDKD